MDCAFGRDGCQGGFPVKGYDYVIENGGIETEEAYPYTAKSEFFSSIFV